MKFRYFLIFSLIATALFSQHKEKLNVLFIISDDLTATAVSSYETSMLKSLSPKEMINSEQHVTNKKTIIMTHENSVCKTPNIDKLASEGTRFTRTYSQYPVCGPSRASLLTGYYPSATITYGYVSGRESIGAHRNTLPQLFKNNGYYTARVSKIYHMGVPIDIETGSNGEDDEASWTERFNSKGSEWKAEGEAELVQNNPDGSIERKGGNVMTIVKAEGNDLVHSDGKTAEKAIELIKKHKKEPFFLAVGFVRPHVPFVAPKSYFKPYPFEEIEVPKKVKGDWDDIPKRGINYVTSKNAQMNLEQEKKAIAAYYASVSYMDAQVGKVLKTLKDEGLEDNTIVVFTSDHGFHLGEHDFWMKVSLHEESVRVPMIIKVPGKAPAVCNSFTELLDIYPTLTSLAGLQASKHIQGKDLSPLLTNPKKKVRNMAFSVSQGGRTFLIRTKKWAYIQYDEDAASGMELFDMEKDPQQFTNLAYLPEFKGVVKKMKRKLKAKLQKVRKNDLNIQYK